MDRADIDDLYEDLCDRALHAAWRVVDDDAIVDAAVGHALDKVRERCETLDRDGVVAWIGAVAYNRAVAEARRRGQPHRLSAEDDDEWDPARFQRRIRLLRATSTGAEVVALSMAEQAAFDLLPENQAAALFLHLRGQTDSEIARHLAISESVAGQRIHDGRENLRAVFGDDLDSLLPRQRH